MTVSAFLTAVNNALRGIDDVTPAIGTEESDYWIQTLNRKIDELYRNSKVLWDATWEVKSLGAISASATPSFNTDSGLIAPSDQVYAVDTNSKKVYYDLIRPRQLPKEGRYFYLAGNNPQVLYCTNEIEAGEDIVTGTLYLPGYYMPTEVSNSDGTDVLPLPDPYWGVIATAAEVASNDIIYEDKEANLNAKANSLYMQMVRNNRRNTYGNSKQPAHDNYRIRGTEVR